MYKQTIITILLALVTMTGWGQTFNWKIEGTAANANPEDTLLLIDLEEQNEVATLQVRNGRIIPTSGTLSNPIVCGIAKEGRPGWICAFVLEEGTATIDIDLNKDYVQHIGGTPANDDLMAVFSAQKSAPDDLLLSRQNMYNIVSNVVSKYPSHIVSSFLVGFCKGIFTPSQSLSLIEKLAPNLQESSKIEMLKDNLTIAQETEEGKMFKELTGISRDGQPIKLSDYVGRGKYVLLDFWASWCGPCKAEMPGVIAIFEKYKEKGLEVVGITVNDKPELSDSVVQKMNIPFPQIYKSAPMSTYGVTAIPATILFAPDGTILARGLRGEEIEKKLQEIFN